MVGRCCSCGLLFSLIICVLCLSLSHFSFHLDRPNLHLGFGSILTGPAFAGFGVCVPECQAQCTDRPIIKHFRISTWLCVVRCNKSSAQQHDIRLEHTENSSIWTSHTNDRLCRRIFFPSSVRCIAFRFISFSYLKGEPENCTHTAHRCDSREIKLAKCTRKKSGQHQQRHNPTKTHLRVVYFRLPIGMWQCHTNS